MRPSLFSFLIFLSVTEVFAQQTPVVVSGQVWGEGDPLPGVTVHVKEGGTSVVTDASGRFTITSSAGHQTLTFQVLGYLPRHLEIGLRESYDLGKIELQADPRALKELVVTGQFSPQSLRNSVYHVRVIHQDQIRLRAATNVQSILNTELGIRFSNDLTLGTADVELMGMSGQSVKILLDGVPLIDRGSTRESLGQIDINTIEKIEIVEGPMSVSYGSDALAGVINIITRKNTLSASSLTVTARIQEETTGKAYSAFRGTGTHHAGLGLEWQNKHFEASAGVSRNYFGGWQGKTTGRKMEWMPKEQYLPYGLLGYRKGSFSAWYRFNATRETLKSLGDIYIHTHTGHDAATDQFYITRRRFHQAQSEYRLNARNSLSLAAAYTHYNRATQTTEIDLVTRRRTLALNGNQDESVLQSGFFRLTGQHRFSPHLALQHGTEVNLNNATGPRIEGTPEINDLAYFVSAEIKIGKAIHLRPGLRFIHNSVYDAPPVIPSLNTRFPLTHRIDLRAAYARGFRSPALRELYFTFFDASHAIRGNKDLKAETSDSYNTYLSYQTLERSNLRWNTTIGLSYNSFNNLIAIGVDPTDQTLNTYLNVDKHKTIGFTFTNNLSFKNLHATFGLSRVGRYNSYTKTQDLDQFLWTSEANTVLRYTIPRIGSDISLYLKYSGKIPRYIAETTASGIIARAAETEGFTLADLTFTKVFFTSFTLNTGLKNLFNITRLANTNTDTGTAHSTGGSIPMSYGRSCFIGLSARIN